VICKKIFANCQSSTEIQVSETELFTEPTSTLQQCNSQLDVGQIYRTNAQQPAVSHRAVSQPHLVFQQRQQNQSGIVLPNSQLNLAAVMQNTRAMGASYNVQKTSCSEESCCFRKKHFCHHVEEKKKIIEEYK